MFDTLRLQDALTQYKKDFLAFQWKNEKYKWAAIQCFQENWDINAPDFADMLTRSLSKTSNLLVSMNNFPRGMIQEFAQAEPEIVRAMFVALFDENRDVIERIMQFKGKANFLLEKTGRTGISHYQSENAISVYLWLRYPDKYYIYKYSEIRRVAQILHSSFQFKKGAQGENVRNAFVLYDEMCEIIEKDQELLSEFQSQLNDACYADPHHKTLTLDVGFYISRFYSQYVSNDAGATEKQNFVGEEKGTALADEDVSTIRYWMYAPGENAVKWEEFYQAGIMAIGWDEIGDLSLFASKQEMKQRMKETINPDLSFKMSALATWQFANEMKPGDIVYAKRGLHQLVGRGIVTSDYEYDPSREDGYPNIRHVNWTDHGEWEHPGQVVLKTLTDITQYTDYVRKLEALFEKEAEEEDEPEVQADYPVYSEEDFLSQVYMDKPSYDTLVGLLRTKKNIILQGAPGVGKTYTAKRLAYSMMGVKDQERVMMVQFHQSYSYEDFIEGFRPASGGSGFEIKKGSFYLFCRKAADDLENEYFFIIDEINRGNLSRIFGELFMLIENDKRGNALQLLYSDEKFSVPRNVYIIGMMNTADRSLAMLDYALRRRFAFFEMKPGFESEGFREYRAGLNSAKFDKLIACVESLNNAIAADESLGEGFCIGHSYFCNLTEATDDALHSIVEYELSPLLREYWYDDRTKANDWINRLKDAIK